MKILDSTMIKNSIKWNIFILPLIALLGLATNIFSARILSLEVFATFVILISLKNMLLGFGDLGISTSFTKFFPEMENRLGKKGADVFTLTIAAIKILATSSVLSLCFVFYDSIKIHFKLSSGPIVWLMLMFLTIIEGVANIFERYLEVNFKQRELNLIKLLHSFCFLLPLLFLCYVRNDYLLGYMFLALIATGVLKLAILIILFVRNFYAVKKTEKSAFPALGSITSRFVKTSAMIYLNKVTSLILASSFLIVLISPSYDRAKIAYVALASGFCSKVLTFLLFPTTGITLPIFANRYEYQSLEGLQRIYERIVKLFSLFLFFFCGLLVLNSAEIVSVLYTNKYVGAIFYINVFLLANFFEAAVFYNVNQTLIVSESYKTLMQSQFVGIAGIAVLAFITHSGSIGLPYVILLYALIKCINAIYAAYLNGKFAQLHLPWAFLAKSLLISTAAMVLVAGARRIVVMNAFTSVILGSSLYVLFFITGIRFSKLICEKDKEEMGHFNIPFLRKIQWIFG